LINVKITGNWFDGFKIYRRVLWIFWIRDYREYSNTNRALEAAKNFQDSWNKKWKHVINN